MRASLVMGILLLCALIPVGLTEDGAAASDLVLTGELRAREADRMAVPVTETHELQLKWLITEGAEVEAGQPVARFDPGQLQENLDDQEDRLAELLQQQVLNETNTTLQRLDLELELVRAETARAMASLDAAVPEETLEGVEYRQRQLELARKSRAEDAARFALVTHEVTQQATAATTDLEIRQVRDNIARFGRELASLELRSASSGIVVHGSHPWEGRKFREGDNVRANWLVVTIPVLDTMEVTSWAAEPDIPRIQPGQKARVHLDAYPARVFTGRVAGIGLGGEQQRLWGKSPYYSVRIVVENVDTEIMKPGMSARVILEEAR